MYYSLSIHLLKDISFALYILAAMNKAAIATYVGEGNALHSSTLAWKIPWTEDPVGCSPWDR